MHNRRKEDVSEVAAADSAQRANTRREVSKRPAPAMVAAEIDIDDAGRMTWLDSASTLEYE